MAITILVAYDDNRVIGNKNQIPWHIAEDLKLFKKRTLGYTVLMGRKTWESLPTKPLPGRKNVVLTRNLSFAVDVGPDGPVVANDIVDVCKKAKANGEELFIVGGAKIYELALKLGMVDKIIASRVFGDHEGDVHFPSLPEDRWTCKRLEKYPEFEVLEFTKIRS